LICYNVRNKKARLLKGLIRKDVTDFPPFIQTVYSLLAEWGELMQKKMTLNHSANLLVFALLTSGACIPLVHADQDALGQLYNAITYEDVPKAKAALAAGIDWTSDGKTDHQWSTLHFAVGHTSSYGIEILKLLLANKADVNARAEYRETPLHFAARIGNTVAVKLLIQHRADVNAQRRDRKTPLHLAASNGHVEVVRLLVENKADVNARDLYKNTPLMCAVVAKHKEVETFLRQRGAKVQ